MKVKNEDYGFLVIILGVIKISNFCFCWSCDEFLKRVLMIGKLLNKGIFDMLLELVCWNMLFNMMVLLFFINICVLIFWVLMVMVLLVDVEMVLLWVFCVIIKFKIMWLLGVICGVIFSDNMVFLNFIEVVLLDVVCM